MSNTITVFKGDGIGPEITDAVLKILDKAGADLNYEIFNVGAKEYETNGKLIPDEAFASFDKTKVLLKSPITTPIGKGFRSLNVTLRKKYDLYANIRPAKSNNAVKTAFKDVDLIVFRENTEDLYVGVEEQVDENTVHATKIITRHASERINTCMQLVMNPQQFDIMVMPNLYGDIVSDLTSGLIGGLGLLPSSNLGKDYAMFEAVHGSAPDIAGKHIANPTALLWSACMMLEYLGQNDVASKIRKAVDEVLNEGTTLTPDLHGTATTEAYCDAIIAKL